MKTHKINHSWWVNITLPETNIFAPKNGGYPIVNLLFSWGSTIFRGELYVSLEPKWTSIFEGQPPKTRPFPIKNKGPHLGSRSFRDMTYEPSSWPMWKNPMTCHLSDPPFNRRYKSQNGLTGCKGPLMCTLGGRLTGIFPSRGIFHGENIFTRKAEV